MEIQLILEQLKCSAAAPTPKVLANEHYVYLIFFVEDVSVQGAEHSPFNRVPVDQICSIRFNKYVRYKMGSPSDEALEGHYYYDLGLEPSIFQEIVGSDWIENLKEIDALDETNNRDWKQYRHIILPLKDSCFEVVSKGFTVLDDSCQTMREEVLKLAELV